MHCVYRKAFQAGFHACNMTPKVCLHGLPHHFLCEAPHSHTMSNISADPHTPTTHHLAWLVLQVAGVEGRHIVLLLADSHITEEAMLADVNGLLNTGDLTGECRWGCNMWGSTRFSFSLKGGQHPVPSPPLTWQGCGPTWHAALPVST
jgi:hypothetical protein